MICDTKGEYAVQMLKTRRREAVVNVAVEDIEPGPYQPRQNFDPARLEELAASIRRYGVLSPLSVRYRAGRYELVAGERRLRAAKMAGLERVPCLILEVDEAESGVIALVENLQRQDLDFIEQARGIARLMDQFGMSQEECARRLGKSQSAVANKLRLLKLPEDVLAKLRAAELTERHGRALLRLPDDDLRRQALDHIIAGQLTVPATDSYIDALLERQTRPAPTRTRFVLKDVRVFLNTLQRSVDVMRQGGVDVGMLREQTDQEMVVTIRIRR